MDELVTEQPNPRSQGIDTKATAEILTIINDEDKGVPYAVELAIPEICKVVDAVVGAFKRGGRLLYVGAGTSGRLGVLDASECPPTYGTDPAMVQGIIAGGAEALVRSVEWAEDNEENGRQAIRDREVSNRDVVLGITASGLAPFVIGAMKEGRERGAAVAALSCNERSRTFEYADHCMYVPVGPEIIAGSTRMKSGTAQKLVLNMITTAAMIKIGKVYNNLMVDLVPVNQKLIRRSHGLIRTATGCDQATAARAFEEADRHPKLAILMILTGRSAEEARSLLDGNEGRIGLALKAHESSTGSRA